MYKCGRVRGDGIKIYSGVQKSHLVKASQLEEQRIRREWLAALVKKHGRNCFADMMEKAGAIVGKGRLLLLLVGDLRITDAQVLKICSALGIQPEGITLKEKK